MFTNLPSGTFEIQSDADFLSGTFNKGILIKSLSPQNAFTAAMNNTGSVEVQAGSLRFSGPYVQTAGATILNGGNIEKTGSALDIRGGRAGVCERNKNPNSRVSCVPGGSGLTT